MRYLTIVVFLLGSFFFHSDASGSEKLISLWEVKLGSNQTIGSRWSGMSSYLYTCKSEIVEFPGESPLKKVVFWPNFYWLDTLVSRDTECVLTNSIKGRALIKKWTSEPLLYRHLSSNFYEGHRDLILGLQVRSFRQVDPGLVCKANILGFYTNWYDEVSDTVVEIKPRYQKAIFAPYSTNWSPNNVFASRDLECTTKVSIINSWKQDSTFTWVEMPK